MKKKKKTPSFTIKIANIKHVKFSSFILLYTHNVTFISKCVQLSLFNIYILLTLSFVVHFFSPKCMKSITRSTKITQCEGIV